MRGANDDGQQDCETGEILTYASITNLEPERMNCIIPRLNILFEKSYKEIAGLAEYRLNRGKLSLSVQTKGMQEKYEWTVSRYSQLPVYVKPVANEKKGVYNVVITLAVKVGDGLVRLEGE